MSSKMKAAALNVRTMLVASIVIISFASIECQQLYHENNYEPNRLNAASLGEPPENLFATLEQPQASRNPELKPSSAWTNDWYHQLPVHQRYQQHELTFIVKENQQQAQVVELPQRHSKENFEQQNHQQPTYNLNKNERQQQLGRFQQQRGRVEELPQQRSQQPQTFLVQTVYENKNYQPTPVQPRGQQATWTPNHQHQQQLYTPRETLLIEHFVEAPQQFRPEQQVQQQYPQQQQRLYPQQQLQQQRNAPYPHQQQQQQQYSQQIQQFPHNQQSYQQQQYAQPAQRYQQIQTLNGGRSTNFQSPYGLRTPPAAPSSLSVPTTNSISQQTHAKIFGRDNQLQPFLPSYYTDENSGTVSTYGIDLCSVCCNPNEDPCTSCCGSKPFLSATALKSAAG